MWSHQTLDLWQVRLGVGWTFRGRPPTSTSMLGSLYLPATVALVILGAGSVQAQRGAAVVDQISPRSAAAAVARVAPVRGAKSSSRVAETPREGGTKASVAPEVVEACRKARAEDRSAVNGIDCLTVVQPDTQARAVTAEAALLPLFGQNGDITGVQATQTTPSVNADAVARQLSTGDVQAGVANGAAAVVGRERGAPPPNSPR